MSRAATVLAHSVTAALLLVAPAGVWAQQPASGSAPGLALPVPDWYHLGNSAVDLSLAGLATGAIDRVWYSPDGATLYAAASGKSFETSDFEKWKASPAAAPAVSDL
jgi:hypothetical protein